MGSGFRRVLAQREGARSHTRNRYARCRALRSDTESGSGANGEPKALGWGAISGLVAVDQPEARLAFVRLDVEANPSTVGQLRMATGSHLLTHIGIDLAFQEQHGDALLQSFNLGSLDGTGFGGERRQLGYVALYASC